MLHYRHVHFCRVHGKQVDKLHIDDCNQFLVELLPTEFNEVILNNPLYDLDEETISKVWKHFNDMLQILAKLEAEGIYTKISQQKEIPVEEMPDVEQKVTAVM